MTPRLSRDELSRLEQHLRRREAERVAKLRSGEQRADEESFARAAGEAPDNGDASVADAVTGIVSAERQRDTDELREIREALGRLEAGTYGVCLKCGEPIDPRRLQASPAARYDLVHQAEKERLKNPVAIPAL